jgi:hypothetical protein
MIERGVTEAGSSMWPDVPDVGYFPPTRSRSGADPARAPQEGVVVHELAGLAYSP